MAIHVSTIVIRPLSPFSMLIEWDGIHWDDDTKPVSVFVQRSFSPESEFSDISQAVPASFYIDASVEILSRWRDYYYRLRIQYPSGASEFTQAYYMTYPPPKIGLEMARRTNLLLSRYTVNKMSKLYLLRTDGPNCHCFDEVSQRLKWSNCDDCFTTGVAGGYMPALDVLVDYMPINRSDNLTMGGQVETVQLNALTTNYPLYKPADILVEDLNHRWRVVTVEVVEYKRFVVHQTLGLKEINPNDIEMKISDENIKKGLSASGRPVSV